MAKGKQPGGDAGQIEELARDIYVRVITGPTGTARTAESLAARAFEDAAAFYAVAARQHVGATGAANST